MAKRELHIISNGKKSLDELSRIVQQAGPFADVVHLREKTYHAQQIFTALEQLKSVISAEKLAVNDRVDAAVACGIQRVHLAWHSLPAQAVKRAFPELIVGCSVHSVEEAKTAEERGADYVMYGHIYDSGSKPGLEPRGLFGLQEVTRAVTIPVIAIGGIRPSDVPDVLSAGASGIAVMSGIMDALNPALAAEDYAMKLK